MSALKEIAKVGTISVIYGRAGELQYHAALECAWRNARSGRAVAVIASDTHLIDSLICWRHAVGVQPGERLRCEIITDKSLEKDPDLGAAILNECTKREISPSAIVLTEPALDPVGIDSHYFGRYLDAARYHSFIGRAVVIACHTASIPNRKPEIENVDLWHCSSPNGSTATLKGPRGEVIQLKSRYAADTLLGHRQTLILEEDEKETVW